MISNSGNTIFINSDQIVSITEYRKGSKILTTAVKSGGKSVSYSVSDTPQDASNIITIADRDA